MDVWEVFHGAMSDYVGTLYEDDAAVVDDSELQIWYAELAGLLPNRDITDDPLEDKARLVDVMCCLLYNNVSHEVCGDFSPFGQSPNPEHKKLVNFENVKAGDFDTEAAAADVFLYDQGAFAGRFNNGGNNLLTFDAREFIDEPGLQRSVLDLQAELQSLDTKLEARNKEREQPFYRMMPRYWEVSISF